jgi:hypothetical protein
LRQESFKLYDSLIANAEQESVAKAESRADLALSGPVAPVAPAPLPRASVPAPPPRAGPIVQPKSISTGGWVAIWVVTGVAILLFLMVYFRGTLAKFWPTRALMNVTDTAVAAVAVPVDATMNAVAAVADSTTNVVASSTNGVANVFGNAAYLPVNPMVYQPSNSLFQM